MRKSKRYSNRLRKELDKLLHPQESIHIVYKPRSVGMSAIYPVVFDDTVVPTVLSKRHKTRYGDARSPWKYGWKP